jgi:hypothetical protein
LVAQKSAEQAMEILQLQQVHKYLMDLVQLVAVLMHHLNG